MIEGLKVTVKGEELRSLCIARSNHHTERAAYYKGVLPQLAELKQREQPGMSSMRDPSEDVKHKIEQHEYLAIELQFIADHLKLDEEYMLDNGDLHKLGIAKHSF